MKVIKRNNKTAPYDVTNIRSAIEKAFIAVSEDKNKAFDLANIVDSRIHSKIISVEEIQDIVENTLIEFKHIKVAKSYILYRDQQARLRGLKENDALIDSNSIIEKYIKQTDWRVKENSNMGYSLQGLNNHISSIVSSNYWLNNIYSKGIRDAHIDGDIHIHDLQLVAPYCVGWDLKDLLTQGFCGVKEKSESKPPRHFRSALGQIVNFVYTLQGEAAGAQAFSNFDTYLAPYVRFDALDYDQVKQCIQEFIFNMNVPTRVGWQQPFSNITMDVTPTKTLGNECVVHGGDIQTSKYKDYQPEMDLINKAFIEVMSEGDSKGRVFTFPIPTYNITKDFDWDSDASTELFKMTAKYGIPYFSNYMNSDIDPDDTRSMCCRLRLDNKELKRRGGGLFGANPMTGSIGVVTINLPRIGHISASKKEFFSNLDQAMTLAKDSLETKREILEDLTEKGLYPYSKHYLKMVHKRFKKYWSNHFSTIGLIGMNEALLNFKPIGGTIGSPDGVAFAEEVLEYMREKLQEYQEITGNMYNLEATPAEGTSRRLASIDKDKYGLIVANEHNCNEDNFTPFYTNSTQLPVGYTDDAIEALNLQDNLQSAYTGGTVFHVYIGEAINDYKSIKKLVKTIASNYTLPYFTISPTFSICPVHGYLSGEHKYCPKCGG